jgi:hypothetical protein
VPYTRLLKYQTLSVITLFSRLFGLVVRVPGKGTRGLLFDFRRCQILREAVGLEQVPLSLLSIIEELLE